MSDDFYQAFENRYRGSRELIRQRLEGYLPFVRPLMAHYPASQALDLGCGRGEWLELLQQQGVTARGVDLDDGMLSSAQQLGLDVRHEDALSALRTAPDASLLVVSAFHLVEHITFEQLREMVRQAKRVLVPGGVLIMETPNPENLIVAGCNFYLDPTHQRPIPPIQLSFLCEHEGFARNKIVRWREPEVLHDPHYVVDLAAVFEGVSQDYAVVAQKAGRVEVMALNDGAFARDYGLTLRTLAERHTAQLEQRFQQVQVQLQQAQARLQQIEAHEQEALTRLTEVYASTSWRLTAPMRKAVVRMQHGRRLLRQKGLAYAAAHPVQRRWVAAVFDRMPAVKMRLVRWFLGEVAVAEETDIPRLPPRVEEIYRQLQAAVRHRRKM